LNEIQVPPSESVYLESEAAKLSAAPPGMLRQLDLIAAPFD